MKNGVLIPIFLILISKAHSQQNIDIGIIHDESYKSQLTIGVHADEKKVITSFYLGINKYHISLGGTDGLKGVLSKMYSLYNPNRDTSLLFVFPSEVLWISYKFSTEQLEIKITTPKPYKALTETFNLRENEYWQMIYGIDGWFKQNLSDSLGIVQLFQKNN